MKKFLIVDGNSIVNRAFYGIRPLSNSRGLPTNAVYGMLNILKKHIDALNPDYMACAYDVHEPTLRHLSYPDYKGTRKGMPDELKSQMPYAKMATEALGFLNMECPGFEADDIIGTSAKMADETGTIETYILTGDRDSLQLISKDTCVILAKTKEDIVYDEKRFFDEYGITPAQFVDVKALMGDSSDNIPGVLGIGEKTALKLIQTAKSLALLYEHQPDGYFGQSPSVVKKLDAGRDSAFMSRELATIRRDAPICKADELFEKRRLDSEKFMRLCAELEFTGMARRFGVEPLLDKSETAVDKPKEDTKYTVKKIDSFDELAFDGTVFIFMDEKEFSVFDGKNTVYTATEIKKEETVAFLLKHKFVCYDFKGILRLLGVPSDGFSCVYDVMLAEYLINPGKGKYGFTELCEEYSVSDIPKSAAVYTICNKTCDVLKEYGMSELLSDIELPLSAVLSDMEQWGFKINKDGIKKYAEHLAKEENALTEAIWLQAGHQFNINSPKQLGEVLFDELGLPSGKKTKTGYSTDADTLESLLPYHTIIADILTYRQIAKLRGTYGDPLISFADEKGRIHTKLNQTGTATGRLASSDPNLQNIPVRMDLGRELRKYFIPEDGYLLIDADYSQIELRLLAVLSNDENMKNAFLNGEDFHTTVASQVFGVDEDNVTPELRRRAKAVNFGIVYGIGEFSLAKDLGISRKHAKEYIESYLHTFSGVDKYLKNTIEEAKKNGYTTTMFGRRRNIPELKSTNRNIRAFGERVSMNSPIQGSAADVIKIAMINVSRALRESGIDARLIMQVHDELIIEAKRECADQAAEILVREMENAVSLSVPLVADCGVGESWYEAK